MSYLQHAISERVNKKCTCSPYCTNQNKMFPSQQSKSTFAVDLFTNWFCKQLHIICMFIIGDYRQCSCRVDLAVQHAVDLGVTC